MPLFIIMYPSSIKLFWDFLFKVVFNFKPRSITTLARELFLLDIKKWKNDLSYIIPFWFDVNQNGILSFGILVYPTCNSCECSLHKVTQMKINIFLDLIK